MAGKNQSIIHSIIRLFNVSNKIIFNLYRLARSIIHLKIKGYLELKSKMVYSGLDPEIDYQKILIKFKVDAIMYLVFNHIMDILLLDFLLLQKVNSAKCKLSVQILKIVINLFLVILYSAKLARCRIVKKMFLNKKKQKKA